MKKITTNTGRWCSNFIFKTKKKSSKKYRAHTHWYANYW